MRMLVVCGLWFVATGFVTPGFFMAGLVPTGLKRIVLCVTHDGALVAVLTATKAQAPAQQGGERFVKRFAACLFASAVSLVAAHSPDGA